MKGIYYTIIGSAIAYPVIDRFQVSSPYLFASNNSQCVQASESSLSDFDRLNGALYFEWLEHELFKSGLEVFGPADLQANGLPANAWNVLQEMRIQEVEHIERLQSRLGGKGANMPCVYDFDYSTVQEFMDKTRIATAVGEGYYLGFSHILNDCQSAQVANTIVVNEKVQNALFRSWSGLGIFGGTSFGTVLTGRQAFTLASTMINRCPSSNPPPAFSIFPRIAVEPVYSNRPGGNFIAFKSELPVAFDPSRVRYAVFIGDHGLRLSLFDHATWTAAVPNDLRGIVFVALTTDGPTQQTISLDDSFVVAGPTHLVIS